MSCIKSIQRGTGSGNATIAINPVDLNKSVVLIFGGITYSGNAWTTIVGVNPIAVLTSNTHIAISNAVLVYGSSSGETNINVPYTWQVIEFA